MGSFSSAQTRSSLLKNQTSLFFFSEIERNTLIIPTEGKHLSEIKTYLNKLNIQFTEEEAQPPYNPDFMANIHGSEEDYKNGRFTRVNLTEELKGLLQGQKYEIPH